MRRELPPGDLLTCICDEGSSKRDEDIVLCSADSALLGGRITVGSDIDPWLPRLPRKRVRVRRWGASIVIKQRAWFDELVDIGYVMSSSLVVMRAFNAVDIE